MRAASAVLAGVLAASPLAAAQPSSPLPSDAAANAASDPMDVDYEPNQQSEISADVVETGAPGFLDGSAIRVRPRTYYLDRNYDTRQDIAGWALGGAVEYRSGWWSDLAMLGATVHTSQKLYAPSDKDGTQLFRPGPEQITVLSELYATVRFSGEHGMRIGRQSFDLPYLGSHDIRMVPNTFEAVAFGSETKKGFGYIAGYVDGIKQKNDDEFVSMSEAAGVAGGDDGVLFGGAQYVFDDGTLIGAINQHTPDVFNTFFAKAETRFPLADRRAVGLGLQYTDQRSVGSDLIGEFDTSLLAARVELTLGNAVLRVGGSTTGSERGIQKPYGNPGNYLSIIVNDFDRAGENAWMIGGNYNFRRVGPGDLTGFVNVVDGSTPDKGPRASPDQTEYNVTVDYRLREGWAENLWIRLRAAYIDQDERVANGDDFLDLRIIVNYAFDAL